jgi:replicative DNA helicase
MGGSRNVIGADHVKKAANIARIIGQYVALRRGSNGNEVVGLCPFHEERTPSFTVTLDKQLFHCFGCQAGGDVFDFVTRIEGLGTFAEAVKRVSELAGINPAHPQVPPLGAQRSELQSREALGRVVATYPYVDERGELLCEVLRIEPGREGKPKEFRQRRRHPADGCWVWGNREGAYRKSQGGDWYLAKGEPVPGDTQLPDVRRVLYRLPGVLQAETVYLVEGEKDVGTLESAGLVATTNSGGAAQKWLPEYTEALRGRRVVIIPDNDEPGRKRAKSIERELAGKAAEVLVVEVPEGKDATEFIEAGHSVADIERLVQEARRKLQAEEAEKRGLLSPVEIVEWFEGGISAFLDPSQRSKGLPTGYYRFDKLTLGLHQGELVILAARPSQGKTALAMNIAHNCAEHRKTVAVFSLEMSREALLGRIICARGRVDQMKFRAGRLDREERQRVQQAFAEICEMPIFIDDRPIATLQSIRAKLLALGQRHGCLDLVVIDYLQLMTSASKENRNQEVGALSRGLKIMAREFRVPFLVLSQLSRAPEQRQGNHRPQLSDLRDSGGVEQDADVVSFIFREEMYKPDQPEFRGLAELIVAKQRNGPVGKVNLVFLHALTKFENRAEDARDAAYDLS